MKYNVTVKPNSKKGPLVESVSDSELVVYLREKAHDGEANAALVKVLAGHFGVGKTSVRIVAGQRGRKKIVEI